VAKKKGRKRQQKKLAQQNAEAEPLSTQAGSPEAGDDEGEGDDEGPEGPGTGAGAETGSVVSVDAPAGPVTGVVSPISLTPGGVIQTPELALMTKPELGVSEAAKELETKPSPPGSELPEKEGDAAWPARLADFLSQEFDFSSGYAYVLIAVVVFAAYANSLWVPFLFDDAPVITRNRAFRELSWKNFVEVLKQPHRQVTNLTFYLNYQVAGTPAYQISEGPYAGTYGPTWTYHVFNMALHALNGILLFILIKLLLGGAARDLARAAGARRSASSAKTGPPGDADPIAPIASWVALGATLLWLVHPAQTMAVSYISQRYAMCGAASFFGTLVCYTMLRRRVEAGTAWLESQFASSLALLVGTFFCYVLCFLTKENSAIAPFVIVVLELTFFGPLSRGIRKDDLTGDFGRWLIPGALLGLFGLAILAALSIFGIDFVFPDHCPTFPDRTSYFQTEWVVILKYLKLYFWPFDLTVEQAFPGLTWTAQEAAELHLHAAPWELFRALVAHTLILGIAVKWWFSGRRVPAFLVASYYLTLAPESSIVPILDPMVEHRLYLPSAFIAVGLAYALGRVAVWLYELPGADWTRQASRNFLGTLETEERFQALARGLEPAGGWLFARRHGLTVVALLGWIAVTGGLGFGTFLRNRVWNSETGIWADTIEKRPDCARAYSSLGMELLYKGAWLEAIEPIEAALYLGPYHVEGWNNIGKAYLEIGSSLPNNGSKSVYPCPPLEWAKDALIRGIEVNEVAPSPSVPLCWNNLGLTYLKMSERILGKDAESEAEKGRLEKEASSALAQACELDRGYETAWINLGTCLTREAERASGAERSDLARKAIQAFVNSHATRPEHQLFTICARNLALAYRAADRRLAAFSILSVLREVLLRESSLAWSDALEVLLADEGAAAAEAAVDLDQKIAALRSKADLGDKTAAEELKDLEAERTALPSVDSLIAKASVRFEARAAELAKSEPAFATRLYRDCARIALARGDVARAQQNFDAAYQNASSEKDKATCEKERREAEARHSTHAEPLPAPGPH
jgi:hypothetical protein